MAQTEDAHQTNGLAVAIAAGKGGTGKTTVAVSLALHLGAKTRLLDCDVEEPNCHIFLDSQTDATKTITVPVPVVDEKKCNACGECARICRFNAIAVLKTGVMIFPELCRGCGGCKLVCPEGAISETGREVGTVETARAGAIEFVQGRLRVGEAMAVPLVRAVKTHTARDRTTIIDCPPGTSCPVVAAVSDSDYVVLVTEPTPFGLHDLGLAVEMVRGVGIPLGVVVNRTGIGDGRVHEYCRQEGIPVLLEIPDDRRIAEVYSRGKAVIEALPEYASLFKALERRIKEEAGT